MVFRSKCFQVMAPGIVAIKAYATVALNAPVHFMVDERAQLLVLISTFFILESPVGVPGHDCHILKVTGPPFIAHGAIMWVVCHKPLDHISPERGGFGI